MKPILDDIDHYEYWFEYVRHYSLVCSFMRKRGVWTWMVKVSGMDKRLTGEAESSMGCRFAISDAVKSITNELA